MARNQGGWGSCPPRLGVGEQETVAGCFEWVAGDEAAGFTSVFEEKPLAAEVSDPTVRLPDRHPLRGDRFSC